MWFVEVLLIYSLGYAAWRGWRRHHAAPFARYGRSAGGGQTATQGRALVLIAVAISVATILVRPAFPFTTGQVGQLKLWQWPQYLGMFGLGIVAVQRGWLHPVPARIKRTSGQAVLVSLVALGLGFAAAALAGYNTNVYGRRLHWAPTLLAAPEGPLAVGTCVWLLGFAQRTSTGRPAPEAARSRAAPSPRSSCKHRSSSVFRSPCAHSEHPPRSKHSS